uniref:interferon-induced, double-stranded RNA-activated protein kinase-like isoform X2 n=1 Tax=Scatophagus argus TaxID=75038 RepID=UPI001ED81681|nr:interferon-induced, double-stranded RNA-activated protein kinase-like isoform X2 [Scatophagus argus]
MMDTGNYIARLNEYAQRKRFSLTYEDGGSDGPDHNRIFRQRAVLNGKVYPDGLGKTKRDAKREAAKNALNDLGKGHQDSVDPTESAAEASVVPVHQTRTGDINYICWLNEYGQKNRVTIKPVESTRPGPNNVTQCCSFVVGDKEYPAATGKTKREAKEEAAKLVHHEICGSKTTENADGFSNSAPIQEKADSVSDICTKTGCLSLSSSFTETNYIGIVNHYCQKTNSSLKFIEERCGPPHNRQFFCKVVINNKQYSEGEGNTVKEAKQNAAQLAWSALQEQSDWDSQVSVRSTASNDGARPTLESYTSPSKSTSESTSDSIIFADSSNPSKAQVCSLRMVKNL